MKIIIEIPEDSLQKDEVDHSDALCLVESGIRYMARVAGNYTIENTFISKLWE